MAKRRSRNVASARSNVDAVGQMLDRLEQQFRQLDGRHEKLRQRLTHAVTEDSELQQRQQRAQQMSQKRSQAKELQQKLRQSFGRFQRVVLECLEFNDLYGDALEEASEPLEQIVNGILRELHKRERIAESAAAWHQKAAPQKLEQWGPATTRMVSEIVRSAKTAISETTWARRARPLDQARYYAGLLCLQVGLLPNVQAINQKRISDLVRRRLARAKALSSADADYPSYTPLPRRSK
jgi:DNA repair exonuclease SbcCD ATPase subunit